MWLTTVDVSGCQPRSKPQPAKCAPQVLVTTAAEAQLFVAIARTRWQLVFVVRSLNNKIVKLNVTTPKKKDPRVTNCHGSSWDRIRYLDFTGHLQWPTINKIDSGSKGGGRLERPQKGMSWPVKVLLFAYGDYHFKMLDLT